MYVGFGDSPGTILYFAENEACPSFAVTLSSFNLSSVFESKSSDDLLRYSQFIHALRRFG